MEGINLILMNMSWQKGCYKIFLFGVLKIWPEKVTTHQFQLWNKSSPLIFVNWPPTPSLHTMNSEKYTQLQPNKIWEAASSSTRCMKFDTCPCKKVVKKSKTECRKDFWMAPNIFGIFRSSWVPFWYTTRSYWPIFLLKKFGLTLSHLVPEIIRYSSKVACRTPPPFLPWYQQFGEVVMLPAPNAATLL